MYIHPATDECSGNGKFYTRFLPKYRALSVRTVKSIHENDDLSHDDANDDDDCFLKRRARVDFLNGRFFQINFRISAANSEIGCLREQKKTAQFKHIPRERSERARVRISLIVIAINGVRLKLFFYVQII